MSGRTNGEVAHQGYEHERVCQDCGETKPLTEEYWSRNRWRRKDGTVSRGSYQRVCKKCNLAKVQKYEKHKESRKARGLPPPAPIERALRGMPLPKPDKPSFRAVLQAKAEAEWPRIAERMIKLASGGDKMMIKLVAAYVLGVPREASEDDGPTEFWHALLARAGLPDGGQSPDVGSAALDLEPGDGPG